MDSFSGWFNAHWFQALQTIGIISGLIFSALALRTTRTTQRVSNLFQLTNLQKGLYSELLTQKPLRRVLEKEVDLDKNPITYEERLFSSFVILHFNLAYQASKAKAILPIEGLEKDAEALFNLPIIKKVWEDMEPFQNSKLRKEISKYISSKEEKIDKEN